MHFFAYHSDGAEDLRSEMGSEPDKLTHRSFAQAVEHLTLAWLSVAHTEPRGPSSRNSYFKREAYRLLKRYIGAGREDIFLDIIKQSPRRRASPAILNQPFKLGLYAMFDDDSLSRNDRKVWGEQMEYAYRSGIEPEMLIGFIYTSGSPALIAQKLQAARERDQST
ncbi:hypothetical protein [Sphingobium chlorophenolicum]|nr:hypothetical protein [Sphingobium chlorophenolicum]